MYLYSLISRYLLPAQDMLHVVAKVPGRLRALFAQRIRVREPRGFLAQLRREHFLEHGLVLEIGGLGLSRPNRRPTSRDPPRLPSNPITHTHPPFPPSTPP